MTKTPVDRNYMKCKDLHRKVMSISLHCYGGICQVQKKVLLGIVQHVQFWTASHVEVGVYFQRNVFC